MSEAVILRLLISQLEPSLYEYQVEFAGEELMSAGGFTSISETIEAAADLTGDIRGFEIAYEGLVVGTYPLETLRLSAEFVALHAVQTVAALGEID